MEWVRCLFSDDCSNKAKQLWSVPVVLVKKKTKETNLELYSNITVHPCGESGHR